MASPVEDYILARSEFVAAHQHVHQIAKMLLEVGAILSSRPSIFSFSNFGSWPMEATMTRDSVSVDGNQWPTKEAIYEALIKLHKATDKVKGAWARVPEDQRESLQPPPGVMPACRAEIRQR